MFFNVECPCGLKFNLNHSQEDLEVCEGCDMGCMDCNEVVIEEEEEDHKIPYRSIGF